MRLTHFDPRVLLLSAFSLCAFAFVLGDEPCDDGDACTTGDTLREGRCIPGPGTPDCDDGNRCTDDVCYPAMGCVHENGMKACSDNDACTTGDICSDGACVGRYRITCPAPDSCHRAGMCDPATGLCSNLTLSDGTACDDGDLCTTGDACEHGACKPSYSGLNRPVPKSSGYYAQLCWKRDLGLLPSQGDQLTDADTRCVAGLTATFAYVATVDDLCAVIGAAAGRTVCRQGEQELIATALNLCRARVCDAQAIRSTCRGNASTSVAQSFADADARLSTPERVASTCQDATCELREINDGRAFAPKELIFSPCFR